MNCDETFNAGICYVTDAYNRVCKFNEELHADLEKYRAENAKLRERVDELEELEDGKRYIPQGWCQLATTENAKLRELAARAWRLFTENGAVHPSDLPEVDAVRDGLRELGVEVDA